MQQPVERSLDRGPSAPRGTPLPPAAAAAPVPAPTAPPIIDPRWQASISSFLASRKIYPEEARRRGEEGRVAVRFTVDRSGRVVDAVIVTASGSTLLDEAALALLREAALPPFPPDMTQPRLTITTMIRYSLR
jgi:protein TonB